VATYFADSHLLLCVAVLLLLRQDFLLLCFGGGALNRLLRLANVWVGSEGGTLPRAMDFAHHSVFFPCALSAWTLTPEPLKHHHQQFCSERPFAIGQCRFFEIRKGACSLRLLQAKVTHRCLEEILKWIDVGRTHEDILAVFHATEFI
jgi:hypothetical protein